MAALFALIGRDPPGRVSPEVSLTARLTVLRRSPLCWVLSIFYLVTFGGFLALSVHLPTLLVQVYGLSLASTGAHVGSFAIVATLARSLGGYLADESGGSRVLHGVFLGTVVLATTLALDLALIFATAVLLGLGLFLGLGNGAIVKLVPEHFPREAGVVSGLAGAVGGLGGLVLPVAQGLAQDLTASYVFGFVLLAVLALVSLLLNVLVMGRAGPSVG